jgi:rsbT antagonist protein RsbS
MFIRIDQLLVITINNDMSDKEWQDFQKNIFLEVKKENVKGLLLNLSNITLLDSYASNTINKIIKALKIIGQSVILIGIQPEVAFSMVQLGIHFDNILTALNFDDAKSKLKLFSEKM